MSNTQPQRSEPETVAFEYLKAHAFRVIKVDGVVGGLSPHGDISINLFNERMPIPQRVVCSVDEGHIGEEITSERVQRDAIVREVEVCAVINIKTARVFVDWLKMNIAKFDEITQKEATDDDTTDGCPGTGDSNT